MSTRWLLAAGCRLVHDVLIPIGTDATKRLLSGHSNVSGSVRVILGRSSSWGSFSLSLLRFSALRPA